MTKIGPIPLARSVRIMRQTVGPRTDPEQKVVTGALYFEEV